jgi:uncharacterized protein YacL
MKKIILSVIVPAIVFFILGAWLDHPLRLWILQSQASHSFEINLPALLISATTFALLGLVLGINAYLTRLLSSKMTRVFNVVISVVIALVFSCCWLDKIRNFVHLNYQLDRQTGITNSLVDPYLIHLYQLPLLSAGLDCCFIALWMIVWYFYQKKSNHQNQL